MAYGGVGSGNEPLGVGKRWGRSVGSHRIEVRRRTVDLLDVEKV